MRETREQRSRRARTRAANRKGWGSSLLIQTIESEKLELNVVRWDLDEGKEEERPKLAVGGGSPGDLPFSLT
jgi:hypothetical protein